MSGMQPVLQFRYFGPDYRTQVDGCEKLIKNGVGFKAQDGVELAELIIDVMKREPERFIQAQLLLGNDQ